LGTGNTSPLVPALYDPIRDFPIPVLYSITSKNATSLLPWLARCIDWGGGTLRVPLLPCPGNRVFSCSKLFQGIIPIVEKEDWFV